MTEFSYADFIKSLKDDWQIEVVNVFRCFDEEKEGSLPREAAIHTMALFGMNGEEHFHFSKKMISVQAFIDAVQDERDRNAFDNTKRWKYIFHLIAGPDNETITTKTLQDFFTTFGHTPEVKFCEDFIDEFDRINIMKTEINLEDWLMFCRIHRLPF